MMRTAILTIIVCLVALFLSVPSSAALIEHNLVVEPNFTHGNERNSMSSTRSTLDIPLPDITLAPGDVLRMTVEFAGGKYLKLGPTPVDGMQQFGAGLYLQSGPLQGTTGYGDGATHTAQIFDSSSKLLFEEIQPASYFFNQNAPQIRWLPVEVNHSLDYGDPTDFTFRKWLFEIEMPISITTIAGATFPFQATTFNNNKVNIGYYLYTFDYVDMPEVAVFVVPEPSSLMLVGTTLLALCRRATATR